MTPDRRTFLTAAGVATAGLLVESARGYSRNDTLQVGLIGVGGRCKHLTRSLPAIPGVRVTAVCDVWDTNLEAAKKIADAKAFATRDADELLARKDVDAVLIATPDHWHVPLTVAACAAGRGESRHRRPEQAQADRASGHPAAEHDSPRQGP
jgi:predicted homoserine dehydrogenase-like protein